MIEIINIERSQEKCFLLFGLQNNIYNNISLSGGTGLEVKAFVYLPLPFGTMARL